MLVQAPRSASARAARDPLDDIDPEASGAIALMHRFEQSPHFQLGLLGSAASGEGHSHSCQDRDRCREQQHWSGGCRADHDTDRSTDGDDGPATGCSPTTVAAVDRHSDDGGAAAGITGGGTHSPELAEPALTRRAAKGPDHDTHHARSLAPLARVVAKAIATKVMAGDHPGIEARQHLGRLTGDLVIDDEHTRPEDAVTHPTRRRWTEPLDSDRSANRLDAETDLVGGSEQRRFAEAEFDGRVR